MKHPAYCGFDCGECPVFSATERKDARQQAALAKQYSNETHRFSQADMYCEGCQSESASRSKLCGGCAMRRCARAKGVAHCAACGDYPCAIVARCLPCDTPGRRRLDALQEGGCR